MTEQSNMIDFDITEDSPATIVIDEERNDIVAGSSPVLTTSPAQVSGGFVFGAKTTDAFPTAAADDAVDVAGSSPVPTTAPAQVSGGFVFGAKTTDTFPTAASAAATVVDVAGSSPLPTSPAQVSGGFVFGAKTTDAFPTATAASAATLAPVPAFGLVPFGAASTTAALAPALATSLFGGGTMQEFAFGTRGSTGTPAFGQQAHAFGQQQQPQQQQQASVFGFNSYQKSSGAVTISEERYDIVTWLYRIRKQNGRKYGLLQPDFICIIFGPLMPNKFIRTDSDIKLAANAWCADPTAAEVKYGHISQWDTSRVTTMKELFKSKSDSIYSKSDFNDDISKWDVSNVTSMEWMFYHCYKLNCDLSKWDVSNVTSMVHMFNQCGHLNCDLSKWDVSKVTNMGGMFDHCYELNCDLSKWNVSSVTNMRGMFSYCGQLHCDISKWDVSDDTSIEGMRMMFEFCSIPVTHRPQGDWSSPIAYHRISLT
jgi:surface protein